MVVWVVTLTAMVMKVVEEHEANHVDDQTKHWHRDEPLVMDLNGFEEALDAFAKNVVRDEHQEYTVEEATQRLYLCVSLGIFIVFWLQLSQVWGKKTNQEGEAVEEHVEGVRNEPQTICHVPINQLHKKEGQVDTEEYQDPSWVRVAPGDTQDVTKTLRFTKVHCSSHRLAINLNSFKIKTSWLSEDGWKLLAIALSYL